jgi:hypothetical protein
MIKFSLACEHGHDFEGWFGSSDDFEVQKQRDLVSCPTCGSPKVEKALMDYDEFVGRMEAEKLRGKVE